MAIKTAIGLLIAVAILAVGAVSASAAPNPGKGTNYPVLSPTTYAPSGINDVSPTANGFNQPYEQAEDGPQTANVPILAWAGEDVRLVACDDNIAPNPLDGP